KGGEKRVHEGWREGRGEAKFVRTCPGGDCGGSLPLSPPRSPLRLTNPSPAPFPTPRTAGDALPLLQLKFVATCRLPGFFTHSMPGEIIEDSKFNELCMFSD
uniref:Uncharacterized protein n=1 Tax=Prolemur simus TaxID=1328070 RepID=A0A8C9DJK7_PROSS